LINEPTDVEELCRALQEARLEAESLHIAMSKDNEELHTKLEPVREELTQATVIAYTTRYA